MRLRSTFVAVASFTAIVSAAVATEAPRAPGAYTSLTISSAAACARACADDGICMAWSFHRDNQCQLSAVVPAAGDAQALATGLSARAPDFLQPRTPIVQAQIVNVPPTPQIIAAAEQPLPETAQQEDDLVLLGGPEDGDLRLGSR
jgi:hypothetical protein